MHLEIRCILLIFRSHGLISMSNSWSLYKWCPLNIFCPLFLEVLELGTVDAIESICFLLIFRSYGQSWRLKTADQCINDIHSLSFDLFAWKLPIWYSGYPWKEDNPYWFSSHMVKDYSQLLVLKKCPLKISWPLCWESAKLGKMDALASNDS